MPVYDYVCSACRHRTEVIHGINEDGPRFCPACGKEGTMRKGFSTPSIVFKGSGWAKKDRATSARRSASSRSSTHDGGSDGAAGSDSPAGDGATPTTVASDATPSTNGGSEGGSDRGSDRGSHDRSGSGSSKRAYRTERSKPASTTSTAAGGD